MRKRTEEHIKSHFQKHDKAHPNYVLCIKGEDLGKNNHLKIEVDPYSIETIGAFLNGQSEEERDNRIRHLFKFVNKEYDELAIERITEYLRGKYNIKSTTLKVIDAGAKKELGIKEKEEKFKVERAVLSVTSYVENVKRLYNEQPFFYDRAKLFWAWNKTEFRWEIIDETDIMNLIDEQLNLAGETVTSGVKQNYLEAFKRIGRKKQPDNAPEKWIQFKDKAFSIKSGKIYKVKANYFFCNPIPWEMSKSNKTPTIDRLFTEWVGEKYVDTLYEIMAYCCYSDYPIQVLFCLYGIGRNGKSCFLRLLSKFLGTQNLCSTDLDLLVGHNSSRFEIFKLYKKLACLMGETNFGVLSASSILKKLVGGDVIGFEKKGKDPFDDFNYAKILIASNSLPSSEDTSEGFYRRWVIIDFPNQFPEGKDILKTIPDKEYEALARKVTELLPKLLEKGEFTNQGTVKEREQRYILASNPLSLFIENVCYEDGVGFIRYSELFIEYVKFLKHFKRRIISKREFTQTLDIEGIEVKRTTKKIGESYVSDRYIEGFSFKENYDTYDFMQQNSTQFLHKESGSDISAESHKCHNSSATHIISGDPASVKTEVLQITEKPPKNCELCKKPELFAQWKGKQICSKCATQKQNEGEMLEFM